MCKLAFCPLPLAALQQLFSVFCYYFDIEIGRAILQLDPNHSAGSPDFGFGFGHSRRSFCCHCLYLRKKSCTIIEMPVVSVQSFMRVVYICPQHNHDICRYITIPTVTTMLVVMVWYSHNNVGRTKRESVSVEQTLFGSYHVSCQLSFLRS